MKPNPYGREKKALNAEMNVVPYIDVMLVLLVIFMVTAPMLITGVDVDLPKEQTNTMSQSQLPVIVSLTDKGDIFISYESNVDVPVSEPELINTLSNLQSQSDNSNAEPVQVMINADQNNQYGAIMTLMATLQQAGIEKVGLLTGAPLPTPSL
ncbi:MULTISPECIES: protein TolR [Psychrobacter]|jgi:biopolymer transport protein TolR|uniref:Protein TolR n=1 Tax=Psychrobacter proteolyticus TaxID=147825 RepID=A0ABV0D274_9GAMM|nr:MULTISPECIES: protein TolR [Psychrobacter]MBA6244080.1 protein TolR [Psychrobacter sp. Urea-trap-18]MBA6284878.1 protein TolR [Psychrobacter sp. Urea-trap-16]MBA6319476.1 protein TolR [Psychrobacter sp. Urea-trap-20]MBA6335358.1 protein TolR [Psychrobacter sp. Urea-trap-19]MDN3440772.1 protein TolR [Psychrobacter sp. APC 3279]|tara:strand:- start:139 stop:597 length:459 start_codon:yes stop_codon:yes gene_type:complete